MSNNEHNDKVLAEISTKLREIEDLKATLKPADAIAEVSLEQCNAGAREAHFAKFEEQERIKAAVNEIVTGATAKSKTEKPAKKATKDE